MRSCGTCAWRIANPRAFLDFAILSGLFPSLVGGKAVVHRAGPACRHPRFSMFSLGCLSGQPTGSILCAVIDSHGVTDRGVAQCVPYEHISGAARLCASLCPAPWNGRCLGTKSRTAKIASRCPSLLLQVAQYDSGADRAAATLQKPCRLGHLWFDDSQPQLRGPFHEKRKAIVACGWAFSTVSRL
jgi:hypothetical protein